MRKGVKMTGIVVLAVVVLASGGLLGYGRSKVRSDGVLFIEGTAFVDAPMERAFSRIVSADGLKAWWLSSLDQVAASPTWPEPGGTLTFKLGSQPVTYTSVTIDRPRKLVARGEYPDASSTVTHELSPTGDGVGAGDKRVLYRKTVEGKLPPGAGALKTWMLGAIIGLCVPREVKKAAAYAARE